MQHYGIHIDIRAQFVQQSEFKSGPTRIQVRGGTALANCLLPTSCLQIKIIFPPHMAWENPTSCRVVKYLGIHNTLIVEGIWISLLEWACSRFRNFFLSCFPNCLLFEHETDMQASQLHVPNFGLPYGNGPSPQQGRRGLFHSPTIALSPGHSKY